MTFEGLLGAWAFGEGESLAGAVCQKVVDYVALHYQEAEPLAEDLEQKLAQLSDLLPALGTDHGYYAGAVGLGADDIAGVILEGNTRERMIVVQQFVYGYLNQDIADGRRLEELSNRADEALGIQWEMLEQASDSGVKSWETGAHNRRTDGSVDTEVANGDVFRAKRTNDLMTVPINLNTATLEEFQAVKGIGPVRAQAIVDYRNNNGGRIGRLDDLQSVDGIGPKTVDALRTHNAGAAAASGGGTKLPSANDRGAGKEVGKYESKFQESKGVAPGQDMQWSNPTANMVMNEANDWVVQQREIGNPLRGGPSGHTHKFMMVNQILGMPISADEMRIVALGHLLPIQAHSAVEVQKPPSRSAPRPMQRAPLGTAKSHP